MAAKTNIAWCDHTFNPFWGCMKVSDGCTHCYAETFSKRVGQSIWGPPSTTPRRLFGAKHWGEPLKWNAAALATGEHRRVFCASMADVFEAHPMIEPERQKLWLLIKNTPWLDWQLLTKRPENVLEMVPAYWLESWPANAWIGTSVEHQAAADIRIPILLKIPARVRFLSCEPLLGPVALKLTTRTKIPLPEWPVEALESGAQQCFKITRPISWVIVGGESGPKHRPLNLDWARSLRDQCQAAGVAYFFKQVGGRTHAEGGNLLDGREWTEFPGGQP